MYAMQITGYDRICVNPALHMSQLSEIMKVGTWDYFQPTADGRTQFTITEDIINEFRDMEAQMFDNITDEDKNHCWGFLGDEDTTVNCREEFESHFSPNIIEFHGGHRLTNAVNRDVILPFVQSIEK